MKILVLVLAVTAGCYQRDLADCAVSCATAADCPSGLACTASGHCAGTAATACGGGDDTDAPTDGPPQTGIIHVIALDDRGLPSIGLRVIATASFDGAALADTTTVADGTADLVITGEADVTVVVTTSLGSKLTTIRNVEPGTTVTFGRRRNEPPSVTRMITWSTDASAVSYVIFTSCGDTFKQVAAQGGATSQSTTIQLDPTCANDFDIMVTYTDGALQTAQQFQAANSGDVVLSGAFTFFTQMNANFAQRPPDVANGNLQFTGRSIFRSSDPAVGPSSIGVVAGGSGGATSILQLPISGSVGRELYTLLNHDPDPGERIQRIAERVPPQGQYNLNIEPLLLPWITSNATVDLDARTVTWTQTSAGPLARTSGDLIAAEINYTRGPLDFSWRIIAPPSAAQPTSNADEFRLAILDLPGTEVFEPRPTDTVDPIQHLRLYGFTSASGVPVSYIDVSPTADLAVSTQLELLETSETFLTTGLGAVDLSRMVVSLNKP